MSNFPDFLVSYFAVEIDGYQVELYIRTIYIDIVRKLEASFEGILCDAFPDYGFPDPTIAAQY